MGAFLPVFVFLAGSIASAAGIVALAKLIRSMGAD